MTKKEHKPISSAENSGKTEETRLGDFLSDLKLFDNRYKNLSLSEFEKVANSADTKKVDEDLAIITDLLIGLTESINICNKTSPKTEFYNYHASRIKHLSKILENFAWFEKLRKKQDSLFFYDNLQLD